MAKIKKNDQVIVIAGKDKGKQGKVLSMLFAEERVLVSGINMVTKHVKPNPNKGIEGGLIKREAPLNISNIAIYNPMTKKADRVGFKFLADGKKVRIFKSTGELIEV